ncbi:MAG: hypothetical protein ACI4VN_07030 [Clostridia bacterium]
MSSNLNGKSDSQERLDDIYSQMVYEEHVRNTKAMYGENTNSNNDSEPEWWNIENEKRRKIRYYYSNYSFKKLFIDFFLIIITSGLAIFFFIYRHKKHIKYREKVKSGEWKEEDFKKDINLFHNERKDAKFLDINI